MFDISFSELVVIGVVALIVIGPERLPRVARTAGALLGRLQRYVNDVKADIGREMQIEDLKKMQDSITAEMRNVESSVKQQLQHTEDELNRAIHIDSTNTAIDPSGVNATVNLAATSAPVAGVGTTPVLPKDTVKSA